MPPLPSPAFSIPLAQNTAPVFEYSCLFTHDLRRKSKRWQDGFLKFHTFNNRVMVYDVTRNFIGDTYQRNGLEDGDELELERGGVLVQVAERQATEETDISEIIAKRQPKSIEGPAGGPRLPSQLQPRSTNLAVTPRTPGRWSGWTGRAQLPQKSPFAQKQAANIDQQGWEMGRAAKRQRTDDDEHIPLSEILRPGGLTVRSMAASSAAVPSPLSIRPADTRTSGRPLRPLAEKGKKGALLPSRQPRLHVKQIIDMRSSPELPGPSETPQGQGQGRGGVYNSSSPAKPPARPPAFKQREPPQKVNIVQTKLSQTVGGRNLGPLNADVVRAFRPLSRSTQPRKSPEPAPAEIGPSKEHREPSPGPPDPEHPKARTKLQTKPTKPVKPRPQVQAETSRRPLPSSPPVSITNHIAPPVEAVNLEASQDEPQQKTRGKRDEAKVALKPLRLGGTSRPRMLMCQQVPQSRSVTPTKRIVAASEDKEEDTRPRRAQQIAAKRLKKRREFLDDIADSTPAFETMDTSKPLRNTRALNDSRHPCPGRPLSALQQEDSDDDMGLLAITADNVQDVLEIALAKPSRVAKDVDKSTTVHDSIPKKSIPVKASKVPEYQESPNIMAFPLAAANKAAETSEPTPNEESAVIVPPVEPPVETSIAARQQLEGPGTRIGRTKTMVEREKAVEAKPTAVSPVTTIPPPAADIRKVNDNSRLVQTAMPPALRPQKQPLAIALRRSQPPAKTSSSNPARVPSPPPLAAAPNPSAQIQARPQQMTPAHGITSQPSQMKSALPSMPPQEPIVPAPASRPPQRTSAVLPLPPPLPQPQPFSNRAPLRRTNSATLLTSPTKTTSSNLPPEPRQVKKPWIRSTTIANPARAVQERQKAAADAAPVPPPTVVDEKALANEKRISDEKRTQGPWTREAWDLFGRSVIPKAKAEKLSWEYKEVVPAARMVGMAGEEGKGGTVVRMNEVRALGGFVSAGTGRSAAVA